MKELKKEQIVLVKSAVDRMLFMLQTYDVSQTAKFQPILQIIIRNVNECIYCRFDGITELSKYIYEDWRTACVGEKGIENWYLNVEDLRMKGPLNREFEEVALSVEKVLNTNYIVPRKWYGYEELITIGEGFKVRSDNWYKIIVNKYPSPIKEVPEDIWSFAKMLCIADKDEDLMKWFLKDIPVFGYISPKRILEMENGADILRNLMYDIPM